MANVKVGDSAPDFTLKNQDNEDVTLSALRGKPVVLVFYPLDFSGICTTELCAIRDDYSAFEQAGATVLGISRDSRHTHKAFKEANGINHDLLADMKGDVAKLYGSWNEEQAFSERLTDCHRPGGHDRLRRPQRRGQRTRPPRSTRRAAQFAARLENLNPLSLSPARRAPAMETGPGGRLPYWTVSITFMPSCSWPGMLQMTV